MKNTVLTSLKSTIAVVLILFTTHAYATDWETCSTAPSSKETFVFPVTYTKNLEVGADTQASLLETIRTEAALCEVFPYRLLCGWDGYIYRYELTFERYLPFYRFKQRVASASRMDIEQCVSAFDGLNNREKASLSPLAIRLMINCSLLSVIQTRFYHLHLNTNIRNL